jgi:hypothetical protein
VFGNRRLIGRNSEEKHTWSVRVSQCLRSMSVTTRPGASGVPLWSSLCVRYYDLCPFAKLKGVSIVFLPCLHNVPIVRSSVLFRNLTAKKIAAYLPETSHVTFNKSWDPQVLYIRSAGNFFILFLLKVFFNKIV